MRCALSVLFVWSWAASGAVWAQKPPEFVLVTESNKTRVGELLKETALDIELRDIQDGTTLRLSKVGLRKLEKGISDDTAIRIAGLPAVVAWHVARNANADRPVGKVASVSQNVIYLTLGEGQGITVGQQLDVFRKANEIRDPDTNKVIAVERPKIGKLEVTEVNATFSKGKVVSALEIALQTGDEVEPLREKFQVAVLPFRSEEGEILNVAAALAEELTTSLAQKEITVLERSALDKVLTELVLQNTVLFEPEKLQRIGQLAGASAIVTGKIVATGKLGTAYVRLIDVQTGKILYAASGKMSLVNATVVGAGGDKPEMKSSSKTTGPVKRRPVPRGAFQSEVVEWTDDAPPNWIFKLARVGNPIMSDRNYMFATLPKEIAGGALIWRDSEQTKKWLEPGIVIALKECTVFAIVRSRAHGKVEIDEVMFTKLLREGWEEVDANIATTFPAGGDWRWKVIKKEVPEGDVILQLTTVDWGRDRVVLFVFK